MTGATSSLRAERRARPFELEVRGAFAWKQYIPPALRVVIGGQYPLGPDRPVKGDGSVVVGPWPDRQAQLALVDDKRQVVCYSAPISDESTGEAPRIVDLPPPNEVDCMVLDEDDRPVEGALLEALVANRWQLTARNPLPTGIHVSRRAAGRTNAAGRVTVHVPWDMDPAMPNVTIVATRPGYGASVSGYVDSARFCDFAPDDSVSPMQFVLRNAKYWRLRVAGIATGTRAHLMLTPSLRYRFGRSGQGMGFLSTPMAARNGDLTALAPANSTVAYAYLRLPAGRTPPPRVACTTPLRRDGSIDLEELQEVEVTVRDQDGRPAAHCHVGLRFRTRGYLRQWPDHTVADAHGKVLVLANEANWIIFATDGRGFAAAPLADAEEANLKLSLRELPFAELRLVDSSGKPIEGARLACDSRPRAIERNKNPSDEEFGRLACARTLMATARSDSSGLMHIPLTLGAMKGVSLARGSLRSAEITVREGQSSQQVVLH